jgi:hypothetical protein
MSDNASAPQEEKRIAPDQLPLPVLPESIAYDLAIVITDARIQLYDELNRAWTSCFPEKIPTDGSGNLLVRVSPTKFFPPFVAFGVRYYDAYARAILRLQPNFSDYQGLVNFALKSHVCDELAPYRPVGERHQRLSQWQLHMGTTWRLFDHPHHSALLPAAQKLIDALEDVMEQPWETFLEALHKAMSRRTLPLLEEGLKSLRNVAQEPDSTAEAIGREAVMKTESALPERAARVGLDQPTRLSATVMSPTAARKMEAFLAKGIGQTELAIQAGTTDRTLRNFRRTGKIRRDLLDGIAKAMGTTRNELLKPD